MNLDTALCSFANDVDQFGHGFEPFWERPFVNLDTGSEPFGNDFCKFGHGFGLFRERCLLILTRVWTVLGTILTRLGMGLTSFGHDFDKFGHGFDLFWARLGSLKDRFWARLGSLKDRFWARVGAFHRHVLGTGGGLFFKGMHPKGVYRLVVWVTLQYIYIYIYCVHTYMYVCAGSPVCAGHSFI